MSKYRQYLYKIGLEDKRTGEKLSVKVWAKNKEEAGKSLDGWLTGWDGEYRWTGAVSEVHDEDGKVISRW